MRVITSMRDKAKEKNYSSLIKICMKYSVRENLEHPVSRTSDIDSTNRSIS